MPIASPQPSLGGKTATPAQAESIVLNSLKSSGGSSSSSSSSSSYPAGTLYNASTGQIAIPNANVTTDQTTNALKSGYASLGNNTPIAPTVTPTISTGDIKNSNPFSLTATTPMSDINKYVNGIVTDPNQPVNPLQNERNSLKTDLQNQYDTLGTKSDRAKQLENSFNVSGMTKELIDLNSQIAQRKNFFTQQIQTAEDKAIPTPFIVGEQTQIQRQSAIELGALASVAQALQGNIQLANDTIDRTLKLEFEPVENRINNIKSLLDLNYQDLTTQEKKRADLTTVLLNQQQKMVDDIKSAKKDAYNAVINSDASVGQKSQAALNIAQANNTDDIYGIALKYGAPKADTQVVDVGGNKVLINAKTGNTIKVLGSSGAQSISLTGEGKPLADAFNSAVAGMPGTQLPTATKTFTNLVNEGDVEGAKNYIIRVALANASTDQQNQAIGRKTAVSALTDLKSLLEQAKTSGADTGIVSGTSQQIAEKLGRSGNKDLAYIGNQIAQTLQTYRKSMTGVAFSPSESAEYKKIFPDITNVNDLNTTKIDSLIDTFDRNNRAVLSFYIGDTNYDKLFGKRQVPILPSSQSDNPFSKVLGATSTSSIYDAGTGFFNIPQ